MAELAPVPQDLDSFLEAPSERRYLPIGTALFMAAAVLYSCGATGDTCKTMAPPGSVIVQEAAMPPQAIVC